MEFPYHTIYHNYGEKSEATPVDIIAVTYMTYHYKIRYL